jgi:hypothetical protein
MIEVIIGILTPIFYFGHIQAMEEIEKEDLEIIDIEFKMKKQMKEMREIDEKIMLLQNRNG